MLNLIGRFLKRYILPARREFIGKTVPEIRPYLPIFYQAFENNSQVLETSAYSAISEDNDEGKFWRLALILKLKSKPTKKQLKNLEKLMPKKIPVDIPVIYEFVIRNIDHSGHFQ